MVNRFSDEWSWKEDLDDEHRVSLARRIIAELDRRLHTEAWHRSYAATGHPRVSTHLDKALTDLSLEGHALRKIERQSRPPVYLTSNPELFAQSLSLMFTLGPPEVSLLAIDESLIKGSINLEQTITEAAEISDYAQDGVVCMDFDSGDLMRIV